MIIPKNLETIHRNIIGTCSKCGEKFYGGDYVAAKLLSSDAKGKMRCPCGNVDEWMNWRDYGVKRKTSYSQTSFG